MIKRRKKSPDMAPAVAGLQSPGISHSPGSLRCSRRWPVAWAPSLSRCLSRRSCDDEPLPSTPVATNAKIKPIRNGKSRRAFIVFALCSNEEDLWPLSAREDGMAFLHFWRQECHSLLSRVVSPAFWRWSERISNLLPALRVR
jgi:hypothetical protein